MFVPIVNIALGLVMVIGGLTGKLAFIGTTNSTALAAIGGVFTLLGVWQLVRAIRRGE